MALAFVSYSRKDVAFAGALIEAFETRKLETWIDWQDIPPSQDWLMQIYRGIEEADSFVFLISPDSIQSGVCRNEIAHAAENNKRLIPIVVRDVNASDVPPEIAKLNWIFFRDGKDDFENSFRKLLEAIHTDFEWVQTHRRLQVKALEWQRQNKETSLLLRGRDLQLAEQQLVTTAAKDPQPTDLQREYVLASRKQSVRQRRLLTGVTTGAAVIMLFLAAIGIYEARQATAQAAIARENEQIAIRNEKTAQSRQLSAQSLNQLQIDPSLAFLLSIEALNTSNIYEARDAMFTGLTFSPYLGRFIYGNPYFTTSVAFSPDGKLLAAGSCSEISRGIAISLCAPDEIRIFDVSTGEQVSIMLEKRKENEAFSFVHSLAFSPDGVTLASGSDDGVISLWDIKTGQPINETLGNHQAVVRELLFDLVGKRIASAGGDLVNVWDVRTGQLLGSTKGLGVALLPDNSFVAFTQYSSGIQAVDPVTGNLIGGMLLIEGSARAAILSPVTNLLAVLHEDNKISIHDWYSGTKIAGPFGVQPQTIIRIAFSPDGSLLASAGMDKTIVLWDVRNGTSISIPLAGHTDRINSIAFSPDGLWLASGAGNWGNFSRDNRIILWDLKRIGTLGHPLSFAGVKVYSLALNTQSPNILAIGNQNEIQFWDWTKDEPIGQPLISHSDHVSSLDISSNGSLLVSAGWDGKLILWDLSVIPPQPSVLIQSPESLTRAIFSPDGSKIAAVDKAGNLTLWLASTHQQIGPTLSSSGSFFHSLAFSRDGSQLAVGGYEVVLFNVSDGKELARWKTLGDIGGALWAADFTPDLRSFVSIGGMERNNYLQSVITGESLGQPLLQFNLANSALFSPDGALLAISDESVDFGSRPSAVLLWEMNNHQQLGEPLYGNNQVMLSIAFTPDGKTMLTGDFNGNIFSWNLDLNTWKSHLCMMAHRNLNRSEWNNYLPNEPYRRTCPDWPEGN